MYQLGGQRGRHGNDSPPPPRVSAPGGYRHPPPDNRQDLNTVVL